LIWNATVVNTSSTPSFPTCPDGTKKKSLTQKLDTNSPSWGLSLSFDPIVVSRILISFCIISVAYIVLFQNKKQTTRMSMRVIIEKKFLSVYRFFR
jgi:hypothetical protein